MFITNKLSKAMRLAFAFGAASSMLAAGAVSAQTETEEEEAKTEKTERIQVVGSRIRTDGIDNATPIEIISADIAKDQGLSTLGELLRTSTVAAGSDQLISAYSVGFVTNGGAGAESISMRGLGANRTLVLLNGRRAGPAGTRGTVSAFDMNALPVSAIERVEILKDGASSLYGSDAVAGVINIITKKGDDASINVSGSKPFESGGETYRINGTYGNTFDRGSWRVVADYNVNTGLKRGDREFFDCQERLLFDASTGERADPIDPRTGNYHCTDSGPGLFNLGGGRFQYDYTNYGFPGVSETNTTVTQHPDGWYWAGHTLETDGWLDGLHPFRLKQTMIPESAVSSLFFQGDYDLNDDISVYGEFLHSSRKTEIDSARQFWTADIGYVPIGLAPGWEGTTRVLPVALTDHYSSETTIDYTRAVIGVEGMLGDWYWDASWQRTHNSGEYQQDIIIRDAMLMAQNALLGGPCAGAQTPLTGRDCVQVNWFTPEHINGQFSDEVRGFLFGRDVGKTIYKQDTIDAYITGDLFELPAGVVSVVTGAAYQSDMINDTPGVETRRGNSWGLSSAGITAGSANTKAVYAETKIPVLRDLPLVESLDITASGRWTDVNTYGSDTTYKIAASWVIGDGFQLRASRGSSFRAPALFELYLDNQTGFLGQTSDPCVNWIESTNPRIRENCAAAGIPETYIAGIGGSMTSVTGGGAGVLEAETSVSKGIGLSYVSPENTFGASVDYYDVTISDQVSSVSGAAVLGQCYTSENFANEPFCNQITRRDGTDGDWGVAEVRGGYLNTSEQRVRGVDFKFTYQDTFSFGDLRMVLNHTNQIERSFQQFSDSDRLFYIKRVGNPKHVGTLATTLTRDDWQFNWNISYFSKTSNYHLYANENRTTLRGTPVTFLAETPTYILHAASVSYNYGEHIDLTVGVANLFDKQPPVASPAASNVVGNVPLFASQLDYLGRRAFVNMTYTF